MASRAQSRVELILSARNELSRALRLLGPETGKAARQIERELKRADRSLKGLEGSAGRAGKSFINLGRVAEVALGGIVSRVAAFASASLTRGIRDVTRDALDFGVALAEVTTILPDASTDVAQLSRQVRDLAQAQGANETVVARGLYQTISAGFGDAADAAVVLGQAAELATAGVADTNQAVDLLTTALNAYRLEVTESERISDVFFETVRLGKTTVSELAGSIGQALPLASALGIDIEQVAAALAVLTQQGFNTSEAATLLRATFKALLKEGDDIDRVFRRVGQTYDLTTVGTRGLADVLQTLRSAIVDDAEALEVLGGRAEATQALIALTGQSFESLVTTLDALRGSAGATDRAFKLFTDTSAFRFRQFFNAVRVEAIEFGDAIVGSVAKVIDEFGGLETVQTKVRGLFQELAPLVGDAAGALARLVSEAPLFQQESERLAASVRVTVSQIRELGAEVGLVFTNVSASVQRFVADLRNLPDIPGLDIISDPFQRAIDTLTETRDALRATKRDFVTQLNDLRAAGQQDALVDFRGGVTTLTQAIATIGPELREVEGELLRFQRKQAEALAQTDIALERNLGAAQAAAEGRLNEARLRTEAAIEALEGVDERLSRRRAEVTQQQVVEQVLLRAPLPAAEQPIALPVVPTVEESALAAIRGRIDGVDVPLSADLDVDALRSALDVAETQAARAAIGAAITVEVNRDALDALLVDIDGAEDFRAAIDVAVSRDDLDRLLADLPGGAAFLAEVEVLVGGRDNLDALLADMSDLTAGVSVPLSVDLDPAVLRAALDTARTDAERAAIQAVLDFVVDRDELDTLLPSIQGLLNARPLQVPVRPEVDVAAAAEEVRREIASVGTGVVIPNVAEFGQLAELERLRAGVDTTFATFADAQRELLQLTLEGADAAVAAVENEVRARDAKILALGVENKLLPIQVLLLRELNRAQGDLLRTRAEDAASINALTEARTAQLTIEERIRNAIDARGAAGSDDAAAAIERERRAVDDLLTAMVERNRITDEVAASLREMNNVTADAARVSAAFAGQQTRDLTAADRIAERLNARVLTGSQKREEALRVEAQAIEALIADLQAQNRVTDDVAESLRRLNEHTLAQAIANDRASGTTRTWGRELQRLKEQGVDALADGITDAILGLKTWEEAWRSLVATALRELVRLIVRMYLLQDLLRDAGAGGGGGGVPGIGGVSPVVENAKGAVFPGGFRAFAHGGVVNKTTLGVIGEGKMAEAVVPLPDNRNIPVRILDMPASSAPTAITFQMTIHALDGASVRRVLSSPEARSEIESNMRDAVVRSMPVRNAIKTVAGRSL